MNPLDCLADELGELLEGYDLIEEDPPEPVLALDDKQMRTLLTWMAGLPKPGCVIRSRFEFSVTSNGIGEEILVTDHFSGEDCDLTDIDSW